MRPVVERAFVREHHPELGSSDGTRDKKDGADETRRRHL